MGSDGCSGSVRPASLRARASSLTNRGLPLLCVEDPTGQLRLGVGAEDRDEQLGRRLLAQGLEVDPLGPGPDQPPRQAGQLGPADAQVGELALGPAAVGDQGRGHLEQVGGGPVQVLEDDQDPLVPGQPAQHPGEGGGQLAGAARAGLGRRAGLVRVEAGQPAQGLGGGRGGQRVRPGVGHEPADRVGEHPGRLGGGRPGGRGQHLAHRPEGQALPVGQAAPPEHVDPVADLGRGRPGQGRLADPGVADQQHQPVVVGGVVEGADQPRQVGLAADHRLGGGLDGGQPERLHHLDRLALAAEAEQLGRADLDRVAGRPQGPGRQQDLVGLGRLLDPGRGVDRRAGHPQIARPGAGRDLAGVQPDAEAQGDVAEGGLGRLDDVAHGQRRPHRPGGVVVVPGGEAEHGQDGVADVLLQGPAEAADLGGQPPEGLVEQVAGRLRVERLDQAGRVDQVGEEHGHDPPLLEPARQALAAGGAEARRGRRGDPAGGAGHAGRDGSEWGHGPHLGCGAGAPVGSGVGAVVRSSASSESAPSVSAARLVGGRRVQRGRRPRWRPGACPSAGRRPGCLVGLHGAHGPSLRDGGWIAQGVYMARPAD